VIVGMSPPSARRPLKHTRMVSEKNRTTNRMAEAANEVVRPKTATSHRRNDTEITAAMKEGATINMWVDSRTRGGARRMSKNEMDAFKGATIRGVEGVVANDVMTEVRKRNEVQSVSKRMTKSNKKGGKSKKVLKKNLFDMFYFL
jgi:hypothetical protein